MAEASPDARRLLTELRQVELILTNAEADDPSSDAIDSVMKRIRDHEAQSADAAPHRRERPEPKTAFGASLGFLVDVKDAIVRFVYHPIILFATVSLCGILVGFADRMAYLREIQEGFVVLMMNL
ncbi:MAG: hypothetical protein MI741_23600 [Rhodospirillales bacterium]|nr:hypothetical protein [Rhodospirillales bacterium]